MGTRSFLVIALILSISSTSRGQVDSGSFNGIPWGSEISTLQGFIPLREFRDYKICQRNGDVRQINGVGVETIRYEFYKEKFYAGKILFSGDESFRLLRDAQRRRYGPEERKNRYLEEYEWASDSLMIILSYSDGDRRGSLEYVFKPIFDQITRDENCCTP